MDLKKSSIFGVKWTSLSMLVVTGTQLLQLTILSRFLTPEEFGLMAIVMVVIGFSQSFMDMGISNAIIHFQKISNTQLSSLYWLNIFSGFVLFLFIFLLAPIITNFYASPNLYEPLILLSFVFIIIAIGNQYRILCQKELQFDVISKIEITASIISLIIAVKMGMNGFGIFALVGAIISQAIISSLLFFIVGIRLHHKPSLIFQFHEIKNFYSFGLYQMGERSINYISANIDKLLIGWLLGMEAVGFYNMAWYLIIFPLSRINPVINKVAFPVYAKIQDDSKHLNNYYFITLRYLSLVVVPMLAFLSLNSHAVVYILFGDGWETTADLVSIMSIVGILKALGNPGGALLLALGFVKVGFWWNLFWALIITITIFLGITQYPNVLIVPWILLGLSLSVGFIWHFLVAFFGRIKYREISFNLFKIILVSFLIAIICDEILALIDFKNIYLSFSASILLYFLFYLFYLFKRESELLKSIFRRE